MTTWQRLTTLGGVLVSAAGLYASRADLATSTRDLVSALTTNTVPTLVFLAGLVLIGWANWDRLGLVLGFGPTNGAWLRQVRAWTHEKRHWELIESGTDRQTFRVVFRIPKTPARRTVNVARKHDATQDVVIIATGIQPNDKYKAELAACGADSLMDVRDELVLAMAQRLIDVEIRGTGTIDGVAMATTLPGNVLPTESAFFEAVQTVVQAADTVDVLLSRALRKARQANRRAP